MPAVDATRTRRCDLGLLAAIPDLGARVAAVEARLLRDGPASFVRGLEAVTMGAVRGRRRESDAMIACALWLARDGSPHRARLDAAAEREPCALAKAILAQPAALKSLPAKGRLAEVSIPEHARAEDWTRYGIRGAWVMLPEEVFASVEATVEALSCQGEDAPVDERLIDHSVPFGMIEELEHVEPPSPAPWAVDAAWRRVLQHEKTGVCMRAAASWRARLARHPSAFTVRRLLESPSTERVDAVRVAARRPTTAEIAREVATSLRWMSHADVREAFVSNPFSPPALALPFLPLVGAIRQIAARANVHPAVREAARALLAAGSAVQ